MIQEQDSYTGDGGPLRSILHYPLRITPDQCLPQLWKSVNSLERESKRQEKKMSIFVLRYG